jgi:hypothetical protein
MLLFLRLALLATIVLACGCNRDWERASNDAGELDAGRDATAPFPEGGPASPDAEAGVPDAQTPRDAGDRGLDASSDAGTDASLDASADAQPPRDAQQPGDSSADTSLAPDTSLPPDTGTPDAGAPDAGPPVCPTNHGCPAAHPCVPNAEGFTCLGQRADWPIPFRTPGQTPALQNIEVRTKTLIDNVTGLMWERKPASDYLSQPLAAAHCEGLELDGYSDFRLPSMIEMATWLGTPTVPQLDSSLLSEPHPQLHWTSSVHVSESGAHWSVNLMDGIVRPFPDTETFQVQCVRTHARRYVGANTTRFSALGTVPTSRDRSTGLTWEATIQPSQTTLSFAAAVAYCDQLSLDGSDAWNVPSLVELFSTFDVSQQGSQLVTPLLGPITREDCYWSDTRSAVLTAADYRFVVVADDAWAEPRDTTQPVQYMGLCAVRCVHD